MGMESHLIVTAASRSFGGSLLSLIGSLRLNWPAHPRVLVYDLGLDADVLGALARVGVEVRKVPAFCPHWRKHFTWRSWCLLDVPAETYFWLDAGTCVLRPSPEVFESGDRLGYFCCTNHWPVDSTLSLPQRRALNVSEQESRAMVSINAGVHALRKADKGLWILRRFSEIAMVEGNMAPADPWHRHDQPLLTVLFHQAFGSPLFGDFKTYAGWESPREVANQAIWVHRTRMKSADHECFIRALDVDAKCVGPYAPSPLDAPTEDGWVRRIRIRVAKWRGRYPCNCAGEFISDGMKD
jgi:hypothetical protein